MFPPGLRMRQTRERLGLTYRDVESASFQIAAKRGRPDFILHISRLADIENRNVVPSLHKLYSLAVIYHLDPLEITCWYDAPLEQTFHDGAAFPAPRTHLSNSLPPPPTTTIGDDNLNTLATGLLNRLPLAVGPFPRLEPYADGPYRYVRNPLYLGTLLVAAGLIIASRRWLLAALFAAVFVLIYLPVIELEEQHLSTLFPNFIAYSRRVPSLWPTLRPAKSGARFQWSVYLRNREYQALLGLLAGEAFLIAKALFFRIAP